MVKREVHNFSRGSIPRNIMSLALPMTAAQLINVLYSVVDRVYLGRLPGHLALTGLGLTIPIVSIIMGFANLCGTGGAPLCSIKRGQGDNEEAERVLGNAFTLLLIFGAAVTAVFLWFKQPLLYLFGASDATYPYADAYMTIYLLGTIFVMIGLGMNPFITSQGFGRTGMMTVGLGAVVNIVLDLVFIVIFRMGVAGAAIATDISQLVSCVLSLRFLIKSTDDCRVIPRAIRLHKKMAARIIRVGLPTGIQNMVISFSNVLVQASVNSYGAAAMAGFAAYMKIDGFNILPVSSISMAATTFVGQNYGAGRLDRVKKGTWVTLAMGLVYTLATGALLLLGQDVIMHLFTNDETVVFFGEAAMHWFCPFYFLLSILHGLAGAVRGTGASVPPMVVLLVSLCLFRIVWIQWVLPLFSGIEGVFILYPVSWALGAGLMILYAWKGKWMEYHA